VPASPHLPSSPWLSNLRLSLGALTTLGTLGLLTACSDPSSAPPPDAPAPDAPAPDAPAPDAPSEVGPVTVRLRMNDPAASPPAMTVISTDPDGAVRAMVDADAAGVATIDVVAGGDVTARYAAPTGRVAVRSFLGVAPGDDLLAGVLGERTSIGDFYYGWTQSTVTQAEVHDRCGSGRYTPNPGGPSAARIWLRLRADCADASPVVFWSDRGSAVDPAVTRAPGGTHTFTTLTAPTTHTDLVRGIPAGVTLATITTIGDYRGVTFADGNTRFGAPTGSTFTSTRPWPVGVTPSGAYYGINKKGFGSVGVATRGAAYAADLDLSAHWLPFIGAAQTDPATRRVTWDQEAGRAGDGAYVTIVFDDAGTTIFWQVIGPAADSALRLPALPPAFVPALPIADDITTGAMVFDVDTVTTYQQFRALGLESLLGIEPPPGATRMVVAHSEGNG